MVVEIHVLNSSLTHSKHSNAKTRAPFKPKSSTRGTSTYQLRQYAEQTLGSGSLRKVVKLPEGEDQDEWLAVNGPPPSFLPLSTPCLLTVYSRGLVRGGAGGGVHCVDEVRHGGGG